MKSFLFSLPCDISQKFTLKYDTMYFGESSTQGEINTFFDFIPQNGLLNVFDFTPKDDIYKEEYLSNLQYQNILKTIPSQFGIYSLDKIEEVLKSKNNSFNLTDPKTLSSHIKKLELFINCASISVVDPSTLSITEQIIYYRLRHILSLEYNHTESCLANFIVKLPIYKTLFFSFDSVKTIDCKYVYYAILLTTLLIVDPRKFKINYPTFLETIKKNLHTTILYFSPLHSSVLSFKENQRTSIERICYHLLNSWFPPCFERFSKWPIPQAKNSIFTPPASQCYNLIVSRILELLLLRSLTITSYELAISFADRMLCDIKKKLFPINQDDYINPPSYKLPTNPLAADKVQYLYNNAMRKAFLFNYDYYEFYIAITEAYECYLSHLTINESLVLSSYKNSETT